MRNTNNYYTSNIRCRTWNTDGRWNKGKYKIPDGTQTGTKFTIRNRGFKSINSSLVGDFVFTVTVQTPKRLTKEQRELLVQLAKTMNEQPPVKKTWIVWIN